MTLTHRFTPLLLPLAVLALVLALWDALERETAHTRRDTETAAQQTAANLAHVIDGHTARAVRDVDHLLTLLREHYKTAPEGFDDQLAVFRNLPRDDFIVQIAFIDRDGYLTHSNLQPVREKVDLSDREHFRVHRAGGDDQLFISPPVFGRLSGKWSIPITRRVTAADGTFAGVIMVSVSPAYFSRFYADVDTGKNGQIALVGQDGIIRAQTRDVAANGLSPIKASRHIKDVPLRVEVSLDRHSVFEAVEARHAKLRIWAGAISALLVLGSILLARQIVLQRRANASWRSATARLEQILETAGEGICGVDTQGNVTFINPTARRVLGWSEEEGLGRNLHAASHHHHPDGSDYPHTDGPMFRTLSDGLRRQVSDDVYWRKDGSSVPVEFTVAAIVQNGSVVGAVNVFRDISERKAFEEQRRQSEERFHLLFQSATDAIFVHDLDGRLMDANAAACERLGYSRQELLRLTLDQIEVPECGLPQQDRTAELLAKGTVVFETVHADTNGIQIPAEVSATLVKHNGATAVFSIARDITKRRLMEAEMQRLAHFDTLTELPNRLLLQERLRRNLIEARANNTQVCVCYLDLDGFKAVNDQLGHAAGDELLRHVARRLEAGVRQSDTVARLGGDEFVLVLPELSDLDRAEAMAQTILATLSAPIPLAEGVAQVGASIGIAFFPTDAAEATVLLQAADEAMYAAKQAGKNRWHFASRRGAAALAEA